MLLSIIEYLLISLCIFVVVTGVTFVFGAFLFIGGIWLIQYDFISIPIAIAVYILSPVSTMGENVLMLLPIDYFNCVYNGWCIFICPAIGSVIYFWFFTLIYLLVLFIIKHVHVKIN